MSFIQNAAEVSQEVQNKCYSIYFLNHQLWTAKRLLLPVKFILQNLHWELQISEILKELDFKAGALLVDVLAYVRAISSDPMDLASIASILRLTLPFRLLVKDLTNLSSWDAFSIDTLYWRAIVVVDASWLLTEGATADDPVTSLTLLSTPPWAADTPVLFSSNSNTHTIPVAILVALG